MKKVIIFGICIFLLTSIVIGVDLIEENYDKYILKDNIIKSNQKLSYHSRAVLDYTQLSNGYEINGIRITCDTNNIINSELKKDTFTTNKIELIRQITKDDSSIKTCYFNIPPDEIRKVPYFVNPDTFLTYVGGNNNLSKLPELCRNQNDRCGHGNYNKLVMIWEDQNIKIILKEQDEDGNYYNVKVIKNGFQIEGLKDFKDEIKINDVISSGGEIYLNGLVTCAEWFDFERSQTDCTYTNISRNYENVTHLDTTCKTHINGTLVNCSGYSVNYIIGEMSDLLGTTIIHNHSRINVSQFTMHWSWNNQTEPYITFVPYEDNIINHSQYFRNSALYGVENGKPLAYVNITGDNLDMNWFVPSGGYAGTTQSNPPRINGIGTFGIKSYGEQIGFPLNVEGKVNIDATESTNNFCFYVFGSVANPIYTNVTLKDITCKTNNGAVFYNGALFTYNGKTIVNFTDIIRINTPDLQPIPFTGTSEAYFYWTPNYIINASVTDESVYSNITIYTISDGTEPDIKYNKIGSNWNTPILYAYFRTGVDLGVNGIDRSYYTARMVIKNSSYFSINSSLSIDNTTTNGKKDMIKIPTTIKKARSGSGTLTIER